MKSVSNLNGAVEDPAQADTILKDLVDLNNSVVRLVRTTICHIVYMEDHLHHPPTTSLVTFLDSVVNPKSALSPSS